MFYKEGELVESIGVSVDELNRLGTGGVTTTEKSVEEMLLEKLTRIN